MNLNNKVIISVVYAKSIYYLKYCVGCGILCIPISYLTHTAMSNPTTANAFHFREQKAHAIIIIII